MNTTSIERDSYAASNYTIVTAKSSSLHLDIRIPIEQFDALTTVHVKNASI